MKILNVPQQVTDFLNKNKGSKVHSYYDSSQGQWIYKFLKKGEDMSTPDNVKCIVCKKQGLANDPGKTDAHCLECLHCFEHCHGEVEIDCLCCCVNPHCVDCTWHSSADDCSMNECDCCCNTHCLVCGHENPELCKDEGNKCKCCGCFSSSKIKTAKANKINSEWLKILTDSHTNKINPKHLGPKEILKDIGKFYILFAHGDKKMIDDHKKKLAQYLLNYLMVSCAGEARHTLSKTHGNIQNLSEMSQTILCAQNVDSNLLNRQYMWSAIYDLAQVSGYEVIMESLEELFNLEWITSSYGGKKWAKIAELAKNYCKGDYTEAIFIDGIMNVVHNGGWAFNKYYKNSVSGSYYNSGISMMKLLDYKKEADLKSIYALLVPLSLSVTENKSLWLKAKELEVVDENNELTPKYGPAFEKEKKSQYASAVYYHPTVKVLVPSAAYIEYLKQHTKKEVLIG